MLLEYSVRGELRHIIGRMMERSTQASEKGMHCLESYKTVIKLTKSWSASNCHHGLVLLNNVSDRIFLLANTFCLLKFFIIIRVTVEF